MSFAQEMRDFAAGYKAIAETGRSRYNRRDALEESKNDPFAGYGEEESGGGFMDKLKGFFGGEAKTSEGAVPEPEDKREAMFGKFNSAYRKAHEKGDLKGAETIMNNMKRYQALPDPNAPAKPIAKPAAPKKAAPATPKQEGDTGPGYGLPATPYKPQPQRPALPTQIRYDENGNPIEDEQMYEAAVGGMIDPLGDMPEEAVPVTPASYDDMEAAPQGEPDVARDMSDLAMPGYAAAYRYAAQELEPAAGIQDENEVRARRDAYNRGDNAASHDEVKAIDAIIDPDGKLPANAKSAARIASIWEYYSKRGEEDKAAELINRLSAYDRRNSQTRGMLAQEAMAKGDVQGAVKLIKDAYDQDLPGADMIQPAVLQNGNIQANVVRDGQVVESVEATPQQFQGLIQQVASGQAHSQQALGLISQWEANRKTAKGGGKGGSSAVEIDDDIKRGLLTTRRAYAQALADRDDSPEWQEHFNQVKAAVQAQEERAIAFADKTGGKDRDKVLRALGVGNVPTAATVPGGGRGTGKLNQPNLPTKKNKKGEDEVDEVEVLRRRIQNADLLEQYGVTVDENGKATVQRDPSYKATKEEQEAARKTIEPLRQRLKVEFAKKVYDDIEDSPGYKENYKSRQSENEEALNEFLGVSSPEELAAKKSKGETIDPLLEKGQPRRDFLRMIDAVRRKNDTVDPVDIAKFIDGIARDGKYELTIDNKGRVVYDGKRLYVNDDTLSGIAKLRAGYEIEAKKPKEPPKPSGTARILGAIGSEVGGALEKGNQNLQVRDAQGNSINILSVPGRMIDKLGEKRITVPIPEDTTPMQTRPPMAAPQNDPRGRFGSGKRALPVD